MNVLPDTGYVRLPQIIGNAKSTPPVPAIIPVCSSTWWKKVKTGEYPQPVKLSQVMLPHGVRRISESLSKRLTAGGLPRDRDQRQLSNPSVEARSAEVSGYKPNTRTAEILDAAMGYIESVEYKVGLRWVFYRLLQDGYLTLKDDYEKLIGWASKARKRFYRDWHPDTLVDEGRSISESDKPFDRDDVISNLHRHAWIEPDLFQGQPAVPFLVFEAATMAGQFEHFAPWADRCAFRGDASIPHKWNIAKRCDYLAMGGLPVHILYFGDLDTKGLQIPESAMGDIREWVDPATEMRFTRCGINPGHAEQFGMPEKSLKPGTYEWESLSSDDAGTLIRDGLASVVDLDDIEARIELARAGTVVLQREIQAHLEDFKGDGNAAA